MNERWLDRRQLVVGLLMFAAVPAQAGRGGPFPARRAWDGRGRITVLATTWGDLRARPGADDAEALALATRLVDEGERTLVAASGVPPRAAPAPGDVARLLAATRSELTLIAGDAEGFDELQALSRVASGLASPTHPAFRARRVALAFAPRGAAHPALANYAQQRDEALARRERVREAHRAQALELAVSLPRKALVVTRALGAADLCEILAGAGRGVRLVATEAAGTLLDEEPLFWAGFDAGLPLPGEEGLAPWAEALVPYQEAFAGWAGRPAFEDHIAAISPDTPLADPPLQARVRDASDALVTAGLPGLPEGLPIHRVGEGRAMAYDPFTHRLKVSPDLTAFPLPLVAAILHHELVHVADVAATAEALGTDPRGFALLLDHLPTGIGAGILASWEDHAYERELLALSTLGVTLPPPDGPPPPLGGPDAVLHLLSMLADAGPGTTRWLGLVDSLLGVISPSR